MAPLGMSVVVVVLASLVSVAAPAGARYHEGVVVVWLCCLLFLLTGTALLYGLWLVDRQPEAAWLAVASVSTALYTASFALRLYIHPARALPVADGVDLLMALLWLAMIVQTTRSSASPPPGGPLLLGALTGVGGIGLQVLAHDLGPLTGDTRMSRHVVEGALTAVGMVTVAVLARSDKFAVTVRTRLLVACALATASRALTPEVPTSPSARTSAAAVLGLLATGLFCRESAHLLVRAREQVAALASLRAEELVAHDQQEQLHEVRSGLAALGCAARLLARDDDALSEGRRLRLATLMEEEMDRLGRLVANRTRDCHAEEGFQANGSGREAIALDDVLEIVVASRRLCGQRVEWERTGQVVVGSRDGLVEALSILMVNAAQHAPGASVRVSSSTMLDEVRIVVADDGPGVAVALRPDLFNRGIHGERSHGEGIGLSLAHRIVTSLGGRLQLADPGNSGGAVFEIALPVLHPEVVA